MISGQNKKKNLKNEKRGGRETAANSEEGREAKGKAG